MSQPQIPHNLGEEHYHHNQDTALSRLLHDAGMEIANELVHSNPNTVKLVLSQMRAGTKPYELNFEELGATPSQLVRIERHQQARRALAEAAISKAAAPQAEGFAARQAAPSESFGDDIRAPQAVSRSR